MTTATASEVQPICIADFSFWYGKKQALHNVSLDVAKNEITAFIGPSGCGKSTLLRSINRMNDLILDTRWTGDISVDGQSVFHPRRDVVSLRQQVGMVFQTPNPFPKSIFENVSYGPTINGMCSTAELPGRVERALKRAALWEEVRHRMDELGTSLSGGQQQRLCIARALANDSDILLLDEPCSALDPVSTQRVEELLVDLKREITIVIVTHNLQQAARIADRTAFFFEGHLIEFEESEQLFTRPGNAQTEAYVTGRFG